MDDNGLILAEIAPEKHPKYSPNLYKWLTKRGRKYRAKTSRVYADEEGALFIGMIDQGLLIGQRLNIVLSYGSRAESVCFVGRMVLTQVDGFWQEYMADGRCAIDREHKASFIGGDTRWLADGDSRSCQWCGKHHQVLRRWTEQVQRSAWVNDTGAV